MTRQADRGSSTCQHPERCSRSDRWASVSGVGHGGELPMLFEQLRQNLGGPSGSPANSSVARVSFFESRRPKAVVPVKNELGRS